MGIIRFKQYSFRVAVKIVCSLLVARAYSIRNKPEKATYLGAT